MSPSSPTLIEARELTPRCGAAETGGGAAPRWFRWVAGLAFAAYGVFLALTMSVAAGGSDSSGYLNSARLLAAGQLQTDLRVPPEFGRPTEVNRSHFSPQGFGQFAANPRLPPSYPTGLPLHLALAGKLFGWEAGPRLVQLVAALGAVALGYATARALGVSWPLAAAGAAMLAGFPVFLFTSIQTLSDTLATTWMLAAVWCALRGRRALGWAAAGGAALAVAVLVRPTNLLLAPGLAVLLGLDARRLGAFLAGGMPGAVWFMAYNQALYGGPFHSGYGTIGAAFALHYGWPTALHFAKWLALFLPAVVLVLPLPALVARDGPRREAAGLALLGAGIVGVYLFYDVSHDVWWCLRFILPAVAALILLALLGVEVLARRRAPWVRAAAAAGLAAWALAASWHWTRSLHILYVPGYERVYAEAAEVVRKQFPANALVVCSAFSGTIYYYTALPTLVYDSITPGEFAGYVARARAAGRPVFAAVFELEEEEALRTRCPGPWRRLATVGKIGLWELP
ncbi:MAG: glycosyltransferase family 39 protein [Opitutaceae bacterium]|nr:glycosyltransferase family 39 protein [Opitutaceae bacterium]